MADVWRTYFPYFRKRVFQTHRVLLGGQLYKPGDKRLDAAYTIFYMGVRVSIIWLTGLYPEAGKVKSLFGYQIANMYDFFMVFVVMSGVASLILYLLSKKLQKMMHGVE